jgi:hypothetical protein
MGELMDIDISIGSESLTVSIENPHRFDTSELIKNIGDFGRKNGVDLTELGIDSLITRMIRGVAGCEGGCPSDAKSLVSEGFDDFSISYIEGGILSAVHKLSNGMSLSVKIFPDFH